jgi:mannose-1-phosphate guanylyltransferase
MTAVIMAGGKGERFWPISRCSMPKQFLSLTDDGKTMIQLTAQRLLPLVDYDNMFVVTNQAYIALVREQLPLVPCENILAEPMGRNTAPCIGLAAAVIGRKHEDAVMAVMPSDHLIQLHEMFIDTVTLAADVALAATNLVTIGIPPTYPETGFGYISFARGTSHGNDRGVYKVLQFVEKPDIETAKEYVASEKYLWNSGMFVWKLSTIMESFRTFMPDLHHGLLEIRRAYGSPDYDDVLQRCFNDFNPISIDYGIMEKAESIYVIPGNFGWDDVGSWPALARIRKTDHDGNMILGDVIAENSAESIIIGDKKLIAAIGLNDIVVVDTKDALLICNKHNTQDVKMIIQRLKEQGREELL